MSDKQRAGSVAASAEHTDKEDARELTFEHGYGAQEEVVTDDEALEDVAGVSEEDVREDLLDAQPDDEDEPEADAPRARGQAKD